MLSASCALNERNGPPIRYWRLGTRLGDPQPPGSRFGRMIPQLARRSTSVNCGTNMPITIGISHSDIDPAPAQIVEQRKLDGEPHRVVEGQLHDGKADPDPLGTIATAEANSSASL